MTNDPRKHDNGEVGGNLPVAREAAEEMIDAELVGTFPASDPPSHWAGEDSTGAEDTGGEGDPAGRSPP